MKIGGMARQDRKNVCKRLVSRPILFLNFFHVIIISRVIREGGGRCFSHTPLFLSPIRGQNREHPSRGSTLITRRKSCEPKRSPAARIHGRLAEAGTLRDNVASWIND